MSTAVTLALLRQVIDEHERRVDQTTISVVRCVHDNADTADTANLIQAAVHLAGGRYFRCHTGAGPQSYPGPLNTALARQLELRARGRGIDVSIADGVDGVQVTVDGSSTPTGAAFLLAQVFATLCSASMDAELVAYTYTLAELDDRHAALLWEAASVAQSLALHPLQTLVPIACGSVDVTKHCDPRQDSVRYAVRGDQLVRRQPPPAPDARVNPVLRDVNDPIVLFLGAGASASARIPQGNRLRDMALGEITGLPDTSTELVHGFRRHLDDNPDRYMVGERALSPTQFESSLTLERVLREEFQRLSGRPRSDAATVKKLTAICAEALHRVPPGREALRALADLLPRLLIATVNFDELIEDDMGSPHTVADSEAAFAEARDRGLVTARLVGGGTSLPILKIHGSISDPETLVADIDTTTRGLAQPIADVLNQILAAADRVTWVWVGCSMRDLDMRQWLMTTSADQMIEYWVDPLPAPSVADYAHEVRRHEWAARDQALQHRQITESADVFLPMLVERARALLSTSPA